MRKIYALVLMTAMLFVGTNAWAVDVVGNDRAALQSAINGVTGKQTVTLKLQNNITLDGPIWLGTEYLTDTQDDYAKSIILDLNGHSIEMVGTGSTHNMFVLTRGELLVRNSSATESQIILSGSSNDGSQIFSVYGSYRSSRWNADGTSQDEADSINTRTRGYVSHLEIGERVKIIAAANCLGTGIAVDALHGSCAGKNAATYYSKTLHYFTDVFGSNHGFAYGVRVDLYGDIEMISISSGNNKAYGIKVNGGVRSPKETQSAKPLRTTTMDGSTNNYLNNYDARREGHKLDTIDVPFVYVHNTAKVQTNSGSTKSAAIYASGYAKWLIEGHCEGNIGVSVSSGSVEFHDAVVVSTAENYVQPNGGGSVSGSGSAVVVNSRDAYAGDVAVTITGDTKVAADAGYAIEEVVKTTNENTKVETITIEGGTIEGGDKGAIIVSEKTVENPATDVTVYGGKISGNVAAGTGDITDILPDGGSSTTAHVTTVTDPETGKTTIVVSEGAAPTGQASISAIETAYDESTTENRPSIKVTGSGDLGSFTKNIELKELELNLMSGTPAVPVAQICTIPNGITLTVGRVVMGTAAKIIVEPGGKFIVTGEQGIVAPKVDNILLKTSETAQAIFLFNPAVSSNRHPNATVEFKTYAHYYANPGIAWQRFGIPAYNNLQSIAYKNPANQGVIRTWIYDYNAVADDWNELGEVGVNLNATSMNRPFAGYMMECNATTEGTEFVMTGELVGNTDANLYANMTYTTFANSYTAPVKMRYFYDKLGNGVAKGLYLAKRNGHAYTFETFNDLLGDLDGTMILPMQSFILYNPSMQTALNNIGYEEMVYNPAMGLPHVGAPARHVDNDMTKIIISIEDEYGSKDRLGLAKSDLFTDGFDNGYDMPKLMNDELNIFISEDDYMSTMASNEIENTYIGFSCKEAGNYTINIVCAEGEEFVLQDLSNNALILMTNNASYQFYANENERNDYRFKIVSRQEMPTAVETIEKETISNDGIYTITGQYVGEMSIWNSLPEGMYIVNGVKKIK